MKHVCTLTILLSSLGYLLGCEWGSGGAEDAGDAADLAPDSAEADLHEAGDADIHETAEADALEDVLADEADAELPKMCYVGYSEYSIVTYDNGFERHREYLDRLADHGLNLVRVWPAGYSNWENQDEYCGPTWFETLPFMRSGEGGKYDLKDFNPDFFARLHTFISYAGTKGVTIELTLFDSWGLKHIGDWSWNPWDGDFNVNGRIAGSDYCHFFDLTDGVMVDVEKTYAQKVVRETADFGNVIYEIMNEPLLVCTGDAGHAKALAWHQEAIRWIREIRPDALISIDDGPGGGGTFLNLPGFEIVCPHWGGWGDREGNTSIPEMLAQLEPFGKHVIVDDDGCGVTDASGERIRTLPENQRAWSNDAVDHGASYNHLQDDLYCNSFYLPGDEMLAALGSAAEKCR
jgi:hypothetical protein